MTHLFLSDEHCDRGVEARAEGDGGGALDLELVDNPLGPLRGTEHLDLGGHEADGVRFGDGVLEVPAILRLLGERDELLAGRDGEDTEVLVLRAVFELHCKRGM
jgi:hypothetical protein